jgi:hypothetical protein
VTIYNRLAVVAFWLCIMALFATTGCEDTPKPKWHATGTVLSVNAECAGGWQGCRFYSVVFMEDSGLIYTLGKVYGPPPVWAGFRGLIVEESNSDSSGRVLIARQER